MRFLIGLILLCLISGNCYQIYCQTAGNAKFSIQNNDKKELNFVILTDLHVSPGFASDSALNRIVDEVNSTEAEFTIITGDLSNTGSDAELYAVKKAVGKLIKPCYVLPGNHETNWAESAGLTFLKLWGNDRFTTSHNGYYMVGFNTGPYMKMGDGHVKQEDLYWLKRQLEGKTDGKTLIAFAHYPLADGLDNWPQVTEILKSAGCRLVFCGHGHSLRLYNFNGIPGIMCRSVILGKSPVPGYNIITLRNDSVLVYNKLLNVKVNKPDIRISYLHPDTISELPISPLPDYGINKEYTNIKIAASWSDSSSIFSGPCLVKDSILVYGNSLGYINAFNTRNQKLLWQKKIKGPVYSTPVAGGEIVVLGTIDGRIIGLNGINGDFLWEVKTGRPVLAEGIIEDGSVYIGGGDSIFYRINIRNGKVIWKFSGIAGLVQGKPALSKSAVVFGAWDRYLYCIDKKTGSLKWKWDNGKPQVLYSPGNIFPVCSGDKVFIVAPDRFMTAIDINSGKQIWRTNRHQVRESMGVSPDGSIIYAKLMNDTVIAVSSAGKYPSTIWKVDAGFGYEHNPCPVFADNRQVIAGTRNGMIVSMDPISGKVLWKFRAGISSVNKVIADNRQVLWISLTEGTIVGINAKLE